MGQTIICFVLFAGPMSDHPNVSCHLHIGSLDIFIRKHARTIDSCSENVQHFRQYDQPKLFLFFPAHIPNTKQINYFIAKYNDRTCYLLNVSFACFRFRVWSWLFHCVRSIWAHLKVFCGLFSLLRSIYLNRSHKSNWKTEQMLNIKFKEINHSKQEHKKSALLGSGTSWTMKMVCN